TSCEKAETYLQSAEEAGDLLELKDMNAARRFLSSLALEVFSVAIDPVVQDSTRTAKYCFDIATLLEKYLVSADGSS
ncbi:MAG: hypothetical protein JJ992_20410, partial [Planctomycetes bacterium]|nr:hypothetical protein [Planctomycetota bacterium]